MKDVISIADVLLNVFWREESLPIVIGEREHEFLFEHDFHVIQRIQAEIAHEVGLQGELLGIDFVEKPQDEENSVCDKLLRMMRLLIGKMRGKTSRCHFLHDWTQVKVLQRRQSGDCGAAATTGADLWTALAAARRGA